MPCHIACARLLTLHCTGDVCRWLFHGAWSSACGWHVVDRGYEQGPAQVSQRQRLPALHGRPAARGHANVCTQNVANVANVATVTKRASA
eukprot:366036-Chlamydomonas_euryale.AAC.23